MEQHHFIYLISGTNRPSSNTLRTTRILEQHYKSAGVTAELFSLESLPPELFAPAAYRVKPPAFVAIQEKVLASAGLHLVVPEYNGSFPGALKYFIDMLKFPESFEHKPVAFVGVANGEWGGLRAVEQLQMVFGYRNAHVYPDRIFVSSVKDKLDAAGNLNDASINDRLARQVRGFAQFAGLFVRKPRP
jgi:chromate reductase, NAD(P)H dehydrogenase (quinone)